MSSSEILFGWNPKLDIPSALSKMSRRRVRDCHALVSTIDSSPRVSKLTSLLPLLESIDAEYRVVGDGVVLGGDTLLRLLFEDDFFSGFDELWLFPTSPASPKPETVPITSDTRLLHEPPATLTSWMSENQGIAGLGDGDGLNFITPDLDLAQLWLAG